MRQSTRGVLTVKSYLLLKASEVESSNFEDAFKFSLKVITPTYLLQIAMTPKRKLDPGILPKKENKQTGKQTMRPGSR